MTAAEVELRTVWRSVADGRGAAIIDRLLLRLGEPRRRYHNAVHVMWVLRHIDRLADHELADAQQRQVPRAAALFHDAIYEPGSSHNEANSADLAVRELTSLGWSDDDIGTVDALIRATTSHPADCSLPGASWLFDADLAVLGGSPAEYAAFTQAIRSEYAHVDDDAWRVGRSAVLHAFLDRPRIYRTVTMFDEREVRARANLSAELASLRR
jgi:predicted metal-dependent HD superfamily phosphohydrolase